MNHASVTPKPVSTSGEPGATAAVPDSATTPSQGLRAPLVERQPGQTNREFGRHRQERLFQLLVEAASTGAPCPTNEAIAEALGLPAPTTVVLVLKRLERHGLIRVERSNSSRRVVILATGTATADTAPRKSKRSDRSDGRLERLEAIIAEAAAEGRRCPGNKELARSLGLASVHAAASLVHRLERLGRIRRDGIGRGRRLFIVATGAATAACPPPPERRRPEAKRSRRRLLSRSTPMPRDGGRRPLPMVPAVPVMAPAGQFAKRRRRRAFARSPGLIAAPVHRVPLYPIPDWRPATCQWIEGEPSRFDECKCGVAVAQGSSYCETHHARAYAGLPSRWPTRRGSTIELLELVAMGETNDG